MSSSKQETLWVKDKTNGWKERSVQIVDNKILISKIKGDVVHTLDLSSYNAVKDEEDPKRKHCVTLYNSNDESVEKWTFHAPTKESLDKWIASVKAKLGTSKPKSEGSPHLQRASSSAKKKGKSSKKKKPDDLEEDSQDSDEIKALKAYLRNKMAKLEAAKTEAHLDIQNKVEERVSTLKTKVNEDLRRAAVDDMVIATMISTRASALLTTLSEYLHSRVQYLHNLLQRRVKDIKDILEKVVQLVESEEGATVANISKIFSDTFAALEQDVQQEIKKADEAFEHAKKEKETEMSLVATDLEKSGLKDKLPLYVEQHQLAMGALKFMHDNAVVSLQALLSNAKAEYTADIAFATETFGK